MNNKSPSETTSTKIDKTLFQNELKFIKKIWHLKEHGIVNIEKWGDNKELKIFFKLGEIQKQTNITNHAVRNYKKKGGNI